jgi:hypothetical protein
MFLISKKLVPVFRALISNYVSLQGLDCFYSCDALEIFSRKRQRGGGYADMNRTGENVNAGEDEVLRTGR